MDETPTPSQDAGAVKIDLDIACPGCEYNLRGLYGPVVKCPECGMSVDVPELAARTWDKPWYKAPGFSTLTWPAAWLWIMGLLGSLYVLGATSSIPAAVAMFVALTLPVWMWMMFRASRVLPNPGYGLGIALLMHLLVLLFMGSIIASGASIVNLILFLLSDSPDPRLIYVAILLVIFGFVIWGCRRVERHVAKLCIRNWLRGNHEHQRKSRRRVR